MCSDEKKMLDGNYMYMSCELRRMKIYNWMMVECGQYTGILYGMRCSSCKN